VDVKSDWEYADGRRARERRERRERTGRAIVAGRERVMLVKWGSGMLCSVGRTGTCGAGGERQVERRQAEGVKGAAGEVGGGRGVRGGV
jgi:hypothetical protein